MTRIDVLYIIHNQPSKANLTQATHAIITFNNINSDVKGNVFPSQ